MNKTPVSILQEMMVKKQTVPNYELIHDGGGTHVNTFIYRVTCDGLTATGKGRCKKDAKHEAAKAMLEAIATHRGYPQLPASPAQSPLRTPLPPTVPESQRLPPNVPFVNAVGALKDVCAENNLQEPEYVQKSDVGPPHAKIFTIQCIVATFKENGVARTKKQAKQEAAKKMLDKITDLVGDLKTDDIIKKENFSDHIKNIHALLPKRVNLGFKISEYHMKLHKCFNSEMCKEMIEKLESLIPQDYSNISDEFVEERLSEFNNFLSTVDLDVSVRFLESTDPDIYIVAMRVNTFPNTTQISRGKTEAEAQLFTLLKLINTMIILLK